MIRIYTFNQKPEPGYYRLSGPALAASQGNLRLISLDGQPVDEAIRYRMIDSERLDHSKMLFVGEESLIMRPRDTTEYMGDVIDYGDSQVRHPLPDAPVYDPSTPFPNQWEVDELVRYVLGQTSSVATLLLTATTFHDATGSPTNTIALAHINYFVDRTL